MSSQESTSHYHSSRRKALIELTSSQFNLNVIHGLFDLMNEQTLSSVQHTVGGPSPIET